VKIPLDTSLSWFLKTHLYQYQRNGCACERCDGTNSLRKRFFNFIWWSLFS